MQTYVQLEFAEAQYFMAGGLYPSDDLCFDPDKNVWFVPVSDYRKAFEVIANNPVTVAAYAKEKFYIESPDRETAYLIFADKSNKVIGAKLLAVGGTDKVILDTKIACKEAINANSTSVILVHNHPSGDPLPGKKDIEETQRLKKALDCFDIKLLDHVILGNDTFYSFTTEEMGEC